MKVSRILAVTLAAALPALLSADQTATADRELQTASLIGIGSMPPDAEPCELAAYALDNAARLQAQADFWVHAAKSLNGPESELTQRLAEGWQQREDDLRLAAAQLRARLRACELLGAGTYDPPTPPSQFSPDVTNGFFPLVPGRTLIYEKVTNGGVERIETTATTTTTVIDGVTCRAVDTVEFFNGELYERTTDWFSQHDSGAVWYFGELSIGYAGGFVDTIEGSWRAGVDGAEPGVKMPAAPAAAMTGRIEYKVDDAEDITTVISLNETVTLSNGTVYTGCVVIEEWSPLEPGERDRKHFAPGIGLVLEVNVETGERLELTQIVN